MGLHRGIIRRLLGAGSVAIVGVTAAIAMSSPAFASPSGDLAAATNASRGAHGVAPLALDGQLNAVAQAWANHLAAAGALSHNPSLRSQVSNWSVLGENVGMAGDIPTVQTAFMNSPEHRANILDPRYTQMGVGSASSVYAACNCTVLWVVVDFRRPTTAAAPAPAPAPVRAPAPTHAAPPPPAPAAPTHARSVPTHAVSRTNSRPATTHPKSAAATAAAVAPAPATTPAATTPSPSRTADATASATALSTQLSAIASGSAAAPAPDGADPVSRVLGFADVMAGLPAR